MRIVADTNVIVRAIVADDPKQARAAQTELRDAELVAVSTSCLCEVVWVLSRAYKLSRSDIATAIRALTNAENVAVDWHVVEAGLNALENGGDFADGVIALEGQRLGGDVFVSFDKQAIQLLKSAGLEARQL